MSGEEYNDFIHTTYNKKFLDYVRLNAPRLFDEFNYINQEKISFQDELSRGNEVDSIEEAIRETMKKEDHLFFELFFRDIGKLD